MTGSGERRDERPYEGGGPQHGPGPDPGAYPHDPADPANQPGAYGGYDPNQPPAPGYGTDPGTQGYGAYGGTQGYGGYEPSAYETGNPGGYPAPGPAAPGYGTSGYESQPYPAQGYDTSGYDTSGYDTSGHASPGYGAQGPAAPGYGGYEGAGYDQSAYGYSADSGGYQVPRQAYAPGTDYDSGAYAAYDGPAQPAPPSGVRPGAARAEQASGATAEPTVRRTGSADAGGSGTTGSFRVQVPPTPGVPPSRPAPAPARPAPPRPGTVPGQGRPGARRTGPNRERVGYAEDEFDFVDDDSEQSEDVIDWLKFAETRSERRDERRRQLRNRLVAVLVALAVVALAGGGYYAYTTWWSDGGKSAARTTGGAVLIQLRGQGGEATASAVLADDPSRGTAAMITVPSATVVNTPGAGPVPLGRLMVSDGAGASRDALAQLIGVKLDGSWVVSEPVLEGLVSIVGGVDLAADAEVRGPDGKVLVPAGPSKVSGPQARAYAALRIPGEPPARGAERFGRVLVAVLKVLPAETDLVAGLLRNLANVADPSLPDARLAELLTSMAKAVQAQQFKSADLPVQPDGVLDATAAGPVVKDLLGGTVQVAKAEGPARVMVNDAGGKQGQESARIKMVNAGYSYVPGGIVDPKTRPASIVQYTDDARREAAVQIALTLGLPEAAVQKAEGQMLADVVITLGQDYKP